MTIFNEDNLRKGLDTFTDPAKPRYGKAFENYSAEVEYGTTPELAIERALEIAVKGLTNKDEKLKNARKAAGFSRLHDLRNKLSSDESTATTTKVLPVTHDKTKSKTTLEKARALRDKSNSVFQRIIKWIAIVAVAIAAGYAVTFLLEGITLAKGNEPQTWIPYFVVPIVFFMVIIIAVLRAKHTAKRKEERDEHRENPSTTSHQPA